MKCEYGCGQEAKYQFKNGIWCCSKKCNSCPSMRKKFSEFQKKIWSKLEVKEKHKEAWNKPGAKEKQSEIMKEINSRPKVKEKHSKVAEELWENVEFKERQIRSHQGQCRPCSLEHRKKIGDSNRRVWENKTDIEKETLVSKIFKSNKIKPNKTELFIDNLIQTTVQDQFKYVGDGQVWIGGKSPDWMSINGKKQIIEYFSNYWHGQYYRQRKYNDFSCNKEHGETRKEHFKKYGFNCLVIWEHELKDIDKLKSKLIRFVE